MAISTNKHTRKNTRVSLTKTRAQTFWLGYISQQHCIKSTFGLQWQTKRSLIQQRFSFNLQTHCTYPHILRWKMNNTINAAEMWFMKMMGLIHQKTKERFKKL